MATRTIHIQVSPSPFFDSPGGRIIPDRDSGDLINIFRYSIQVTDPCPVQKLVLHRDCCGLRSEVVSFFRIGEVFIEILRLDWSQRYYVAVDLMALFALVLVWHQVGMVPLFAVVVDPRHLDFSSQQREMSISGVLIPDIL